MHRTVLNWVISFLVLSTSGLLLVGQPVLADPTANSNAQAVEEIRTVILNRARANPSPASKQTQVRHVAIVENYALADVTYGEGGGEILLQQHQGRWQVVTGGGGVMNSATLISFGVPETIATQLVQQLQSQWR
jgi:hypothetical protein